MPRTEANPAPNGLKTREAADRLRQYGPNATSLARPKEIKSFLRRFWGVVPWMLELAVIIDLILGKWPEAGVIATLLVGNAFVGFLQEGRAHDALTPLRERLTVSVRVRRDGQWQTIPATELVSDDLIHLRVGDIVPADVHLTDGEIQGGFKRSSQHGFC